MSNAESGQSQDGGVREWFKKHKKGLALLAVGILGLAIIL
jgi:hypothetical protein